MLRIIVILAAIGCTLSSPQFGSAVPSILEYVNFVGPYGYNFRYKTSDGVGREESGELLNPGTPQENYIVQGRYSWTSPEGIPYVVTFISDNDGYRRTKPETYQPYVPQQPFYPQLIFPQSLSPQQPLSHQQPTPPQRPFSPQQHSVYSAESPRPSAQPARPVQPSSHAADKPTVRPVKQYEPPPKSSSFGPEEDRLSSVNAESPDLQRRADGVVPVGPPKIGAGTAAALLG